MYIGAMIGILLVGPLFAALTRDVPPLSSTISFLCGAMFMFCAIKAANA
jgi:threonine/homoserine/homoserine lactone efflux protein